MCGYVCVGGRVFVCVIDVSRGADELCLSLSRSVLSCQAGELSPAPVTRSSWFRPLRDKRGGGRPVRDWEFGCLWLGVVLKVIGKLTCGCGS